jgi:hypothetical protein
MLKWVKPDHLCFHGSDLAIPSHPARKQDKRKGDCVRKTAVNF